MTRLLPLLLVLGLLATTATAQEAPGWDDVPYAGTLSLSAGFSPDPNMVDVTPGGTNANPIGGPGCVGYIGSRPDVVVEYDAGSYDLLTFSAASETDISLVVRDPYGQYHCDDDSGEGLNPVVTTDGSVSGRYVVWVGVFGSSGEYVDGVFGVSEVGNEVSVDGTGSVGEIIDEPDDSMVGFSGGALASGEVAGWGGSPFFGTTTLEAGFSGDPRTVEINAGGSNANPLDGPGCNGYIGSRPDHVVSYSAGSYDLTFSAAADSDLTLIVRDPFGQYFCDDDSGEGLNPRIDIADPASGDYTVWVGTFSSDAGIIESVLGISEVGSLVSVDGTGSVGEIIDEPDDSMVGFSGGALASGEVAGWGGSPFFGTTTLEAGFSGDPRTVEINAGGSNANPLDGPGCNGYIGSRPDHVVSYSAGSYDLTFSAAADSDLTLIVRDPFGQYFCDDDSGEGLNPRIDIADPASGDYTVWVGTFSSDAGIIESVLGISEIGAEAE